MKVEQVIKRILTQEFDPKVGRRSYFHTRNQYAQADLDLAANQILKLFEIVRELESKYGG